MVTFPGEKGAALPHYTNSSLMPNSWDTSFYVFVWQFSGPGPTMFFHSNFFSQCWRTAIQPVPAGLWILIRNSNLKRNRTPVWTRACMMNLFAIQFERNWNRFVCIEVRLNYLLECKLTCMQSLMQVRASGVLPTVGKKTLYARKREIGLTLKHFRDCWFILIFPTQTTINLWWCRHMHQLVKNRRGSRVFRRKLFHNHLTIMG